jgi:hypothetical protein
LVDTSALFPFTVMDLLLALTEDAVHQVLWTDDVLDEWERVIVREQRRSAETAASVTAAIRSFFADCHIERTRYAKLIEQVPGDDRDDHPHMAAAIAAGADALMALDTAVEWRDLGEAEMVETLESSAPPGVLASLARRRVGRRPSRCPLRTVLVG